MIYTLLRVLKCAINNNNYNYNHTFLLFVQTLCGILCLGLVFFTFNIDILNGEAKDYGPDHSKSHFHISIHNFCKNMTGKLLLS